jgi:hypothetical protein
MRRKPGRLVPITGVDAVRSAGESKEIVTLDNIPFCDEVAEAVQRLLSRSQSETIALTISERGITAHLGRDAISYRRNRIKIKTGNCLLIADAELGKFILLRYINPGWLEALVESTKLSWKDAEKIYDAASFRGVILEILRAILRHAEELL